MAKRGMVHLEVSILGRWRPFAGIWLCFYTLSLFPFSMVQADVDVNSINAAKVNTSAAAASVNCGSICDLLVSSGGSTLGITNPSAGWTTGAGASSDDQYCADHGAPTSPSTKADLATQAGVSSNCTVPMSTAWPQDSSCQSANNAVLQCKLHNSMAINYCMAYQAAFQGAQFTYAAIAFDIATASLCAAACAMGGVAAVGLAAGLGTACSMADVVAGVMEIVATTQMKQSETAQAINYAAASAGIIGGGVGEKMRRADQAAYDAKSFSNADEQNLKKLSDAPQPLSEADAEAKSQLESKKSAAKEAKSAEDAKKAKDKAACATAILFGILTALRIYNLNQMQGTKDSACTSLKSLLSTSTVASGSTSPAATAAGLTGSSVSGTTNASTTSGGAVTSGTGSGVSLSSCPVGQTCKVQSSAATSGLDTGSLLRSGGDSAVSPLANQLDQNGLANKLAAGASAGEALSGAMPAVAGSFGNAIAQLAETVQKNPQEALALLPDGAIPMSGGGGSRASGGGGKSASSFGEFFAPKDKAGPGGTTTVTFDATSSTDIWHVNSSFNIFQIVSERIGRSANRVLP